MYDPRIIANEVLTRANARGVQLTNLDIQKLVYFLHGEFLVKTGKPLVQGDFEAWQFGPVHRILYDAFRGFAAGPIERPARRFDPVKREHHDLPRVVEGETRAFLDSTLDRYLEIPTFMLVQITHSPGTPWSRTMQAAETKTNVGMVIKNELILQYFEGLADNNTPASSARGSGSRRKASSWDDEKGTLRAKVPAA